MSKRRGRQINIYLSAEVADLIPENAGASEFISEVMRYWAGSQKGYLISKYEAAFFEAQHLCEKLYDGRLEVVVRKKETLPLPQSRGKKEGGGEAATIGS